MKKTMAISLIVSEERSRNNILRVTASEQLPEYWIEIQDLLAVS